MQPDRNSAAQIRPAFKRCPDCGEPQPSSAFYERGDGHLSTYCKHHQRERSRASYRRRRQSPDELARMRAVERARKAASRARLRTVDPRSGDAAREVPVCCGEEADRRPPRRVSGAA
jgi:hypothetical protein